MTSSLPPILRTALQRPGFMVLGSVSLGIGLAAVLIVIAALDSLVWRDVPGVREPHRQLELGRSVQDGLDTLSLPDFEDIRDQTGLLDKVYAWRLTGVYLGHDDSARSALAMLVSADYFAALGARAEIGSLSGFDADGQDARPVVATRRGFEQLFDADPSALGSTVHVNGVPLTLAGVLEDGFDGHGAIVRPLLFLPFHAAADLHVVDRSTMQARDATWFHAGARLAESANIEQAQQELDRIAEGIRAMAPETHERFALGLAALKPLPHAARGPVKGMAMGLLVLCVAVLAMACTSLSGILLARGEARGAEFAMRSALGASRRRMIRQLMFETLPVLLGALAVAAALLGWARRALIEADLPIPIPIQLELHLGWNALLAAVVASVLVGTAMGLLPALRVSRHALARQLGGLGTGTVGDSARLRLLLLGVQSALTVFLLVVAALTLRGLERASTIDTGFQLNDVYTAEIDLQPLGVDGPESAATLQRIVEDLRRRGEIEAASFSSVLPLTLSRQGFGAAFSADAPDRPIDFDGNVVGSDFFGTLRIPAQGRVIDTHDGASSPTVAVINQQLATRLFGSEDPIGRSFSIGEGEEARKVQVVGWVPDGRYAHRGDSERPFAFLAAGQWDKQSFHVFIRSRAGVGHVRDVLGESLRALRPDLPEPALVSFEKVSTLSILPQRIMAAAAASLGALSLLLAALGLYALLALQFERRIAEFGLRQALGAGPAQVARSLIAPSLRWSFGGAFVGFALGQLVGYALGSLLFDVSPLDPVALVSVAIALVAVIVLASLRPLWRVRQLAPMAALRQH